MRSFAEDLEEMKTDRGRRFVRDRRRGIDPAARTCWFAVVEQDRPHHDRNVVSLGSSPADVLLDAELHAVARGYARRLGLGTWILEVYGEEGVDPLYLRVVCAVDEAE